MAGDDRWLILIALEEDGETVAAVAEELAAIEKGGSLIEQLLAKRS